jgi:hypothetical protein
MRINKTLNVDIRSDFCTRMRSIGLKRLEIAKLDMYLSVSMDNLNEKDLATARI